MWAKTASLPVSMELRCSTKLNPRDGEPPAIEAIQFVSQPSLKKKEICGDLMVTRESVARRNLVRTILSDVIVCVLCCLLFCAD